VGCSVGSASSLGESVILGYLKDFDPHLTGAWSSGNGIAAVGGTLVYLLLHSVIGLTNQQVFLFCTPTILLYYIAFRWVYKSTVHAHDDSPPALSSETTPITIPESPTLETPATTSVGGMDAIVLAPDTPTQAATILTTTPLPPVITDSDTPLLVNRGVGIHCDRSIDRSYQFIERVFWS
jgi:hypothetical protein